MLSLSLAPLEAQRELLNVLALPFSPLASEGLQQKQVAEIAQRMHRYQDSTHIQSQALEEEPYNSAPPCCSLSDL